jgi:PAS domain S-box-containing protein
MLRPVPLRAASRSRLFAPLTSWDAYVLYAVTTIVLSFAAYRLLSLKEASAFLPFGMRGTLTLNGTLTVILSLEAFLLLWLWIEMPRRRKAEIALERMHSIQRAISRASGRIAMMKPEDLEQGLQREMGVLREVLNVDHVFWFQQDNGGTQFFPMQATKCAEGRLESLEFHSREARWMVEAALRNEPVHFRRLQDLPPEANSDRGMLARNGIRSFALIPAGGGDDRANALLLASVTKEMNWKKEVLAQLSVLASVFASARARKSAQDAGSASELKFRHLFEDCPIGIALLDASGNVRTANPALGRFLGQTCEELTQKNILDVTCPENLSETWLHMQELLAGIRETAQKESHFRRKDGSMVCGQVTLSMAGAGTGEPFLLGMIEDVTAANRSKAQLERSRRMLALALESSRTTAWEYDVRSDRISWLDRNKLRDSEEPVPATDLFSNVLSHVRPEDRDALRDVPSQILRKGGVFSAEFRMIGKDGTDRWMLGKGELLKHSETSAPKIVGVTVDVSEVKRAQFQLQQLAKRLMAAHEEERKRISRDLHDDIGQRVALLAIELDLLKQMLSPEDRLQERVERIRSSATELGTDLHQLSHELHSSKLKHLGLEAALREFCKRITSAHPLIVELNCREPRMLPEEERLVLFRVAQEATNNIIRHSGATRAEISLTYSESLATLVISDDGHGFDTTAASNGIGLMGMRERLRAVGGALQVLSTRGAGSEIRASVPLPATAANSRRQAAAGSFQ